MSPHQRKLAALSRDRQFLIRGVLVILAVCIIAGFVLKRLTESNPTTLADLKEEMVYTIISYESERDREGLANLLFQRGEPTPEAIAENVRFVRVFIEHNLVARSGLERDVVLGKVPIYESAQLAIEGNRAHLTDEQRELFHNYAIALYKTGEEQQEGFDFVKGKAAADPPLRFANEFVGDILSRRPNQREEALPYFRKEADTFERSDFSRFQLLTLKLELDRHDELRALLKDDSYRRLISPRFLAKIGIGLRDPILILESVVRIDFQELRTPVLFLSLFAGLVWFTVLAKLGGVTRLLSRRLLLYFLCVVAGFLSATFTLLLVVWQDDVLGFGKNGEFLNDLIYCVSAIGLREETAKLLFFLPFVPFIAKRCKQIEILIAAGCVGLGFGINESINYFDRLDLGGPAGALPRLLTAAFLHISLTGLLGLAVCRFWHYPKRCWEEAIGTFVAVVLIHGLYDALMIVRQLAEQVGILYIVVLALTVRHYFKKIAETRGSERQVISALSVFVLGSAAVVGIAWIFAVNRYGIEVALDGVGKGALSAGVLAFIYINELKEE